MKVKEIIQLIESDGWYQVAQIHSCLNQNL
jgi:predicted RNA binding protein YcfA (HicA-like mRNA interferase family)